MIIGATYKNCVSIKIGYSSIKTPELKSFDVEIGGLISNGEIESDNAIVEFFRTLLNQKEIDKLEIMHLSKTHKLWEQVKNGLGVRSRAIYKLGLEWIGIIRNAKTGEKINVHSGSTNRTFRKMDRKILKHFKQKLETVVIKTPEQIVSFIKNAEIIDKKSYHLALGVGIENNDYWNKMFHAMAQGGYFRGYLLMAEAEPIAYYQGMVYKDIYYGFLTSYVSDYRNLSPGAYLYRRIVDLLVEENINIYNFGFGDAEYKRFYGTESKTEATFRIYGFSTKARISKFLDQIAVAINENIIRALEKTGLLNKIKKMWRSKLSK